MLSLAIVIASTRPSRVGHVVGHWFVEHAREHGRFDIDPVDLAEIDLPLFNESKHPRLRQYEHDHTKAWSARVDAADAFVFVTPEYNNSTPPSLLNALDYLLQEWAYKPVGFVSYGGISGGLRSVQMTKVTVTTLRMMPLPDGVALPHFTTQIDKTTGAFIPTDRNQRAATAMLDELARWAEALRPLRPPTSPRR
jgi:NAD(P)H-dependent FMN reductase